MSRIVTILIFRINYECCFTFKIIKHNFILVSISIY